MVQLAHERLEFIAAVAIEQKHLPNTLPLQGVNEVGQDAKKRGRRHAASKRARDLQVIGVDAVGNRGQERHACPGLIGFFTGPLRDGVDLVDVRAIGHVQVVWLGGPKGQDGKLPFLRAHKRMILFRQDPFAHK